MPWFKVDDGFHCHPKTLSAGTAALGLWVRCGSWSAQQLTDGFVPVAIAGLYGTRQQAAKLVDAGLWIEAEGGYRFHEWSDRNPLRNEVEELREAKREAGRIGGRASGRAKAKAKQSASTTEAECLPSGSELPNTRPDPTRPSGSKEPSKPRKRATPPPEKLDITNEMREWAAAHAPDVRLVVETSRMLDWARGKGEAKQDWVATWRNWMGRAQDNIRPSSTKRDETPISQAWMSVNQ